MKHQHTSPKNNSFECAHCHYFVSSDPMIAGVRSRNHCPYCLWSRHVDEYEAGDRLAVCKAMMKPIGLTFKKTNKKYGLAQYGELMVIHQCEGCEKISINRIAADDDANLLYKIFQSSLDLEERVRNELAASEIRVVDASDEKIVHISLYGKS